MTTFVLSIWGTPTPVKQDMPKSPAPDPLAATGSFARSKGASRSATGGASRALKRVCLGQQSPASNLDAATGIEGVTVRQLAWFLLECVQWVAVKGDMRVLLLQKPSNAVEKCVGQWIKDVDGGDLYFPPCSDVAD